ncbi:MAG: acetylxylan esterase [Chloroflexi bacterium]|nr:acetylxylan esterase [Chloroflexota bacterium]
MRPLVFGLLLVLVGALALWRPARVAVATFLLLPALFPSAPIDPLFRLTPEPVETQQTFEYSGGTVDTRFFAPVGGGQHPAVVLLLGAGDLTRSDLAVQFADALARLGVVVAVPESSGMLAEHLNFDEVDAIRQSIDAVRARSDVDPRRVGIVGLSASGGLAIVAAAQPDLRDSVRFVNSFGSYDDAMTLLVDVASHSIDVEGSVRDWQPEQRTVDVVANALVDTGVDDATRSELLGGPSRQRATEITRNFSPEVVSRFARISPSSYLTQLHARLYLMHDVDDPFIPFTESRNLVASAPPGVVARYTEFSIFEHVIPERPTPWQTFVPDVWKLFWHTHALLSELL